LGEKNEHGEFERAIPALFYDVDGKELGRLIDGKLIPEEFKQKFIDNIADNREMHFRDTLIISPYISWWPGDIAPKDSREIDEDEYLTKGGQISRGFDLKTPEGDSTSEHSGEEFTFRRGINMPVNIEDTEHSNDGLEFKITLATHNMAQMIFNSPEIEKQYFEYRAQLLQYVKTEVKKSFEQGIEKYQMGEITEEQFYEQLND